MRDITERQFKEEKVKELWGDVTKDSTFEVIGGLFNQSTNRRPVVWVYCLEIFNGVVSNGS